MAYAATPVPASVDSRHLNAAQTQTRPNPSPARGGKRRSFNQLQDFVIPQLL